MTYRSLDWQDQAACAGLDVNLFFPDRYHGPSAREAGRICKRCPVRVDCADYGRTEPFGIWGGRPSPHVELDQRAKNTAKVDGLGARRRLAALARDGYGTVQITQLLAPHIGCEEWLFTRIRYGTRRTVTVDLHDAIDDLYVRLDGVKADHPGADRVAALARSRGWADRAAWRGLNIDDPKVMPREYRVR